MTPDALAGYLSRIGMERPGRPDAATLRRLQVRHALSVPFENLSVHLGEPVMLDEAALVDKLVARQRGGFCYELNGAFAALLRALGFSAELLGAAVCTDGVAGPPLAHMAVRVDLDGEPWLADVGFGRGFARHPLRLDVRDDQPDPEGVFRLEDAGHDELLLLRDGVAQYRLETRPRPLADFEPTCWWTQTSPRSRFTRSLVCSLPTPEGRVTLSGRDLVLTIGGRRTERRLGADDVLPAYSQHFGIVLDREPRLRAFD